MLGGECTKCAVGTMPGAAADAAAATAAAADKGGRSGAGRCLEERGGAEPAAQAVLTAYSKC